MARAPSLGPAVTGGAPQSSTLLSPESGQAAQRGPGCGSAEHDSLSLNQKEVARQPRGSTSDTWDSRQEGLLHLDRRERSEGSGTVPGRAGRGMFQGRQLASGAGAVVSGQCWAPSGHVRQLRAVWLQRLCFDNTLGVGFYFQPVGL